MQVLDVGGAVFAVPNHSSVVRTVWFGIQTFLDKFEHTVPNYLSVFRMVAGLLIGILFIYKEEIHFFETLWISVFIFACFTDWLDGEIARRWPSQASDFGKLIDPIADKVFVISIIVLIYYLDKVSALEICFLVPIIFRECAVALAREPLIGSVNRLSVSNIGKVKAGFQMVGIGVVLGRGEGFAVFLEQVFSSTFFTNLGFHLLVFATGLTVVSGYGYWVEWRAQSKRQQVL